MGSNQSHFDVSVGSDGQSHKTVSTNHNLFEEKGEPKRYRTEVLPLTSLIKALPLGQTGSLGGHRSLRRNDEEAEADTFCTEGRNGAGGARSSLDVRFVPSTVTGQLIVAPSLVRR